MSNRSSLGKLAVRAAASLDQTAAVPEPDTPFRIALLGDFSARALRGVFEPGSLGQRRPLRVDRDNFNDVMAALGVEVDLPIAGSGGPRVAIRVRELEDFHPDRIFAQTAVFQTLRDLRRRLKRPRTFPSAAAEVRAWKETPAPEEARNPPAEGKPPSPEGPPDVPDRLLERTLDETEHQAPRPAPLFDPSQWKSLLAKIVGPYSVAKADPQQPELVASVDAAAAGLMRTILHQPGFQALEAAWRGVWFLASRLEADAQLKLYLFDVSKDELGADLAAAEDLRTTGTYRLLVEESVHTPGGEPWAVLAGNYAFDLTVQSAELLGRMSKIAGEAGAPFVAEAGAALLGCESLAATPDPDDWQSVPDPNGRRAWESLRKLPESSYLGLVLPRFLLRLPYGPDTSGTEQFSFEEMPGIPSHEAYLWGNPCFACVCLLGQALARYGWQFRPGVGQDLEDLPIHVYRAGGQPLAKPCAEVLLTDRAAEAIANRGLMPLRSFQNRGAVRLAALQSLADPPTRLMGRWR